MKAKLSLSQKRQIKEIGQKHGLLFAVVFGSVAKGQKRPNSDFDIAVLAKKKPSYQLFKNLFSEFSEAFKGENVDIRFLNESDPFFRFQVAKAGKLIFGNLQSYNQFRVFANKIFIDSNKKNSPFLERLLEKNQKQLERTVDG